MKKILLIIPILVIAGYFGFQTYDIKSPPNTKELVNLLKNKNLQGAVVQKLSRFNKGSIWYVSQNGNKKLLSTNDLGKVCSPVCEPIYKNAVEHTFPWKVVMSPDKNSVVEEVKTKNGSKIAVYNLPSKVQKNEFWTQAIQNAPNTSLFNFLYSLSCASRAFSPDGKLYVRSIREPDQSGTNLYTLDPNTTFTEDSNAFQNRISVNKSISDKNMCDIVWSKNSNAVLMRDYGTEGNAGSGVSTIWYSNLENETPTQVGKVSNKEIGTIIDMITTREILAIGIDGTYYIALGDAQNRVQKILTKDSKLVGIIP